MKKVFAVIGALAVLVGASANANANANAKAEIQQERLVKVAVSKAYIPQGFDNNDVTKVVVEGFFPNTCYKIKKQDAEDVTIDKNKKTIQVTQRAYVYSGMCLMMLVPFSETVEVGTLAAVGDYKVTDALSARELGRMTIANSKTTGPDDFYYAMVSDAYVGTLDTDEKQVIIRGELPGNCWELTDKKIFVEGKDVLTVLPIMEQTSEEFCNSDRVPFVTTVTLPELAAGRYLLNVRALNGQSVNKLFDMN